MIRLHISCHNYELNDKITAYANKKLGALDKYLPKAVRADATGTVTLEVDQSGREDNQCVCDATIKIPGANPHAREATLNMFAAVDIVEAKLKAQLLKYKDKHGGKESRKAAFVAKLLRRSAGE